MKEELWGVVFDLDGVLVDSATHWKRVDNRFLQELLGEWSAEKQRSIFGMSIFAIYDLLVRDYSLSLSRKEFLGYYTDLARQIYQEQATPIPGSEQLVRELAQKAVPLAVASSSAAEWIELVLDRFELRSLFQAWVGADTVGGEGKPSPRVYLEAARRLNLEPIRCIAIEDSASGVRSGVAAGMKVVGVLNGENRREDLIGATRIVEGFSELSVESLRGML